MSSRPRCADELAAAWLGAFGRELGQRSGGDTDQCGMEGFSGFSLGWHEDKRRLARHDGPNADFLGRKEPTPTATDLWVDVLDLGKLRRAACGSQ